MVSVLTACGTVGGAVSGGHYNPAVTTAMWMENKVDNQTALAYAGAQIAGAVAAWMFYNRVIKPNRA